MDDQIKLKPDENLSQYEAPSLYELGDAAYLIRNSNGNSAGESPGGNGCWIYVC